MEYLHYLLQQYHKGEATAAERTQLLTLLEEQEEALRQQWLPSFDADEPAAGPVLPAHRAAQLLQNMHNRMQPAAAAVPMQKAIARQVWLRRAVWAAAAVLGVVAGRHWLVTTPPAKAVLTAQANDNDLLHIQNTTTQNDTLALPDGSVAILYPGSSLFYKKHFDTAYRSINMEGGACFTVAKDSKRPFTVFANGIATTALGTRFSVTAWAQQQVRVRLLEGKVVVQGQNTRMAMRPVYLLPGQECRVNRQNGDVLVKAFTHTARPETPATAASTITKGVLEFSREPLAGVFQRLEKQFHVNIVCKGVNTARLSFTGTFLPTDSLPVVLGFICKTNDLTYQQKDSQITITSLP